MARSKSSGRWLKEHFDDQYVKQAKQAGYRSRAAFKLLEIEEKDHIFKKGMVVVDLGAAPGGWSQVAGERIGEKGQVFALDLLPMDSFPNVTFLQGDFTGDAMYDALMGHLDGQKVGLVMSDMAPNLSGNKVTDQARSMLLVELALDFAKHTLSQGGVFLAKAFQGEGFDQWLLEVRHAFQKVMIRKPDASRARSREVYVLAKGFRL